MAIEGLGDIVAGIGDVKPETIKLFHDRERLGLDALRDQALSEYYKSLVGQASQRMALETRKLNQADQPQPVGTEGAVWDYGKGRWVTPPTAKPHFTSKGQVVVPDTADPTGYTAKTPGGLLEQAVGYEAPGGAREKALEKAPGIMSGPWTELEKLQLLMRAGLRANDAKVYMDKHAEVTSLAKEAEQAFKRTELGIPQPNDAATIRAFNKFTSGKAEATKEGSTQGAFDTRNLAAAVAAAITGAQEAARSGETFSSWDPRDKEMAFLDKYYSGKDPRFAWGDRKSYTQFNEGYYQWMRSTARSPLMAITDRSDVRSRQGALNDITKRESLINTFVDRIEANAKVVRDLIKKYGMNTNGRLLNQANNLVTRGTMGSGDLESLRLALFSLSNEVTKVETGQLGIAAPSVSQAQELARIHDINLNGADLEKVIETSTLLGQTSKQAMATTRQSILTGLSQVGQPPQPLTQIDRNKITNSPKFKSLPEGEPIIVDGKQIGVKRGNGIAEQ